MSRGLSRSRLREVLDSKGHARLNAVTAHGRYPVVVVAPGQGGPPFQLNVIAEHLASRGRLVVGVPSRAWLGSPADGTRAIEETSQGLQRAIDLVTTLPNADPERVGLLGYSLGGSAAALAAMRSRGVDAVVLLDPGFRVPVNMDQLHAATGFDL
jgi:dienelactone hydrolase